MGLIVNIAVTVLLIMWASVLMMSPMMIASRGIRDDKGSILFSMAILGYPIAVFAILRLLGFQYFGMSVNGWLAGVTIIWLIVIFIYGLPRLLLNTGKGISNNGYVITDNAVHYEGKAIRGADVKSFKILNDDRYSTDKTSVYYYGRRIADARPESFRPLTKMQTDNVNTAAFWRDEDGIYYNGKRIKDCDVNSFELINNLYARDNRRVYFTDRVLVGAEPASFRLLDESIGTDGKAIYVSVKRSATTADLDSLTLVDGQYGYFYRDKDNVYLVFLMQDEPFVKAEGADPDTFTILERSYARDKNHVYFFGSYQGKGQRFIKLEGADPKTFTIGYDAATKAEAHDGTRHYLYGELVKPK